MSSRILTGLQQKAVLKIGDIYCPKHPELPSFSDVQPLDRIDTLLEEIPAQDLKDLQLLLSILGVMPTFVLWLLIWVIENGKDLPTPIGALIRMIRFGFRGIIFSLYYSKTPAELIGYKTQMR